MSNLFHVLYVFLCFLFVYVMAIGLLCNFMLPEESFCSFMHVNTYANEEKNLCNEKNQTVKN